jgi:hypothetical protein
VKLHTNPTTTNHQTGAAQQPEPLNRTLPGETGSARPQGSHELSGLTAAPRLKSSLQASAGTSATKRPASDDGEDALDQPAKRIRLNGVLPSRSERPESALPAQASSAGGLHASQIGAISPNAAGAPQLGGKVIDVPGLPMHSQAPNKAQTEQMESAIKNALKDQHGPVEVFGYHVTTQENADAIRNHGFSADKNQGLGGGVAGMNIHGSGLYTSKRPIDDYLKPDQTNVMYAVVVPKSAEFKEAKGGTGQSWDAASNAATIHDGDFMQSMVGDRKINPSAISKVGLVPVAVIPPSMPPDLLAARQQMASKPAPARTVSPELHSWVSGAIGNHPDAQKAIEAEPNADKKLDMIADLSGKLGQGGDIHPEATQRLLMMDLKKRYMPPN